MSPSRHIICMPIVRYHTIYQRTQHLMKSLGRFARVIYLNPHKVSLGITMEATPDHNVFDTSIPFSPYDAIVQSQNRNLSLQQRRLKALGIKGNNQRNHISVANEIASLIPDNSEVMLFINASYWQPIASKLRGSLVKKNCKVIMVYDVLDNFTFFNDLKPYKDLLMRFHTALMEEAELVTYTANKMLESLIRSDANLYLPNACTPEDWEVCKHCYSPQEGIIGYFGTMAHWFDIDILKELVKRDKIKKIYLIGPVAEGINEHFPVSDKIHILGIQDYKAISRLTWDWSCGIIPFIQTPLTDYTDPVKLYEYMSIGLPIVANKLDELEFIRNNIIKWTQENIPESETDCENIPEDLCFKLINQRSASQFVDMILKVGYMNSPMKIAARRLWASTQTWNHRVDKLLDTISMEWNNE